MSSYSYKVTRETSGPRGGSYSTSSYSSPTAYSPARHGIPSVAHQRLTPVSLPAYSSPLMPYLLMDEDDVVVLPRRRTLARLSDELDDDPVLKRFSGSCPNCCGAVARPVQQVTVVARPSPRLYSVPSYGPFVSGEDELRNWYEDRIHHAQVEASSIAQSHINDLCTPKPRHISVTPMYTPKLYPEPVAPRLAQYTRHRSRAAADPLKPVRRNIELKSRFNSANDAAQNTYKRMGSGHLACLSLLGGPVVSKRTHSRFYNGERVRSEDMAQRLLPSPRDDPSSHRRSDSADPAGRDSEGEAKPAQPESTNGLTTRRRSRAKRRIKLY